MTNDSIIHEYMHGTDSDNSGIPAGSDTRDNGTSISAEPDIFDRDMFGDSDADVEIPAEPPSDEAAAPMEEWEHNAIIGQKIQDNICAERDAKLVTRDDLRALIERMHKECKECLEFPYHDPEWHIRDTRYNATRNEVIRAIMTGGNGTTHTVTVGNLAYTCVFDGHIGPQGDYKLVLTSFESLDD